MPEDQRREPTKELIELLKTGNHSAFREIYDLFRHQIYSLSLTMVNNPDDAGELTQKIFIKLFSTARSFEYRSTFSTWLYRIAMNACYDHLRSRKRSRTVPLDDAQGASAEPSFEESTHRQHITGEVQAALQMLNPKLRSVLVLKYIEELSYAEIAEVLNCTVGTVGSRMNRGHRMLAKTLSHLKRESEA